MKKLFFLLLIGMSLAAHSQKKDLVTVNTVKPKHGQKMAFEAAYKVHVAKFHKGDERMNVYEILSGDYAGYYHLVNGGRSFADFDKERADANAHSLDLDKSFFPLLEDTKNGTFRLIDSLSLRPEMAQTSSAFVVTIRHLKDGLNTNDYKRELARNVKIYASMTSGLMSTISYNFYDKLWDGSDQVTVSIRNLKTGFSELEPPTSPAPEGPSFRELYEKAYGGEAWDARVKLMEGSVVKTEQYIMKLRKDLSSQ